MGRQKSFIYTQLSIEMAILLRLKKPIAVATKTHAYYDPSHLNIEVRSAATEILYSTIVERKLRRRQINHCA